MIHQKQLLIRNLQENLLHIYSIAEIKILADYLEPYLTNQIFIDEAISKLQKYMPIQYILNESVFFGYNFYVDENVLIPRPETEELVDLIIKNNNNLPVSILDIGTGSGCIAITLFKKMAPSKVAAIDISEKALTIARLNAQKLNTNVDFYHADILNLKYSDFQKFDIIVSNPPYVTYHEMKQMDYQVLKFEPHFALFVEDNDPLIFYKKIADFALNNLKNNGKLYFEVNQYLAWDTKELITEMGFKTELIKDINGNYRILEAQLLG